MVVIVIFSPIRATGELCLHRVGDVLQINGEAVDLSGVPEGARIEPPHPAIEAVHRAGGILHVTVILPHGADAPEAVLFPAPVEMTGDGPVPLP